MEGLKEGEGAPPGPQLRKVVGKEWAPNSFSSRFTWPGYSGTLYKVTCPLHATVQVYTGNVAFYKVP